MDIGVARVIDESGLIPDHTGIDYLGIVIVQEVVVVPMLVLFFDASIALVDRDDLSHVRQNKVASYNRLVCAQAEAAIAGLRAISATIAINYRMTDPKHFEVVPSWARAEGQVGALVLELAQPRRAEELHDAVQAGFIAFDRAQASCFTLRFVLLTPDQLV